MPATTWTPEEAWASISATTGLTPSAHTRRVPDLLAGRMGRREASLGRTEIASDEDAERPRSSPEEHEGQGMSAEDGQGVDPPTDPDDASPSPTLAAHELEEGLRDEDYTEGEANEMLRDGNSLQEDP